MYICTVRCYPLHLCYLSLLCQTDGILISNFEKSSFFVFFYCFYFTCCISMALPWTTNSRELIICFSTLIIIYCSQIQENSLYTFFFLHLHAYLWKIIMKPNLDLIWDNKVNIMTSSYEYYFFFNICGIQGNPWIICIFLLILNKIIKI